MAIYQTEIRDFLGLSGMHPIFDVRSPHEFEHAHIPGALSMPIFTDSERAIIGTAYKQEDRKIAIKHGMDAFGPKMRQLIEQVERVLNSKPYRNSNISAPVVLVHCWRGGMRSAAIAWLLDLYGFNVHLLIGGYKQYRKLVLEVLATPMHFTVIGGYTGSGKTEVLHQLKRAGHPVLDLEALACHRGSAFGDLPGIPQPGQEQFENHLAAQLYDLCNSSRDCEIFVEDESQRIGSLNLPGSLFEFLQEAPQIFLDIPFESRLEHILKEYQHLPSASLINAIVRIKKRLGPLETKTAINCLVEGDISGCFSILLEYYDKQYRKAMKHRTLPAQILKCEQVNAESNTQNLLSFLKDDHGRHRQIS